MRKGNKMYETGRFYKAGVNYEKAFKKMSKKDDRSAVAMKVGVSFQDVNRLSEAYTWYRRASQADKTKTEPYIKMAEISVLRGDVDNAEVVLENFNTLFPDDERGKDGIYSLGILRRDEEKSGRYYVEAIKELNSRDQNFAPMFDPSDNNFIYFTSTRPANSKKRGHKTDPVTGDAYSNIFVSEFSNEIRRRDKKGVVKVVRHYPESRWMQPELAADSLKSNRNDGAVSFSSDGNLMYFTSSRMIDGKNLGTRIYSAAKIAAKDGENSSWSQIAMSGVCGDSVSVGHPAFTPDGDRLYFVTDILPEGFGGKDIWYVERVGNSWGEPKNAGEMINTEGDELYPYVRDNGDFYFASNGYNDCIGGLDIYKITTSDGEQKRERLPSPINSYADDFGITFKTGVDEGMFSSSRSGRNDNIFSFAYIPQRLSLNVVMLNSFTSRPIKEAQVILTGDDGSTNRLLSDTAGRVRFELQPDIDYVVTLQHADYLISKEEISTYKIEDDREFEIITEMQPIEKPIIIPDIYFDFAKWDLREDAMKNLESLIKTLNDNPNITIELSAHTDMIGSASDNLLLSKRRAESVVNYLISQGIHPDRLTAKGYGKDQPRIITAKDAKVYGFLKEGDVLTPTFILQLKPEQRAIASQLNRRIEFKVMRRDYKPNADKKARTVAESATSQLSQEPEVLYSVPENTHSDAVQNKVVSEKAMKKVDATTPKPTQTSVATSSEVSNTEHSKQSLESVKKLLLSGGHTAKKLTLRDISTIKGNFFTVQLGIYKNEPKELLKNFRVVFTEKQANGTVRYCVGVYSTREEAKKYGTELKEKGIDNFVREYNN
jgi:peptidoglycan-associated lipoprotein